jgi:hypothetical protein
MSLLAGPPGAAVLCHFVCAWLCFKAPKTGSLFRSGRTGARTSISLRFKGGGLVLRRQELGTWLRGNLVLEYPVDECVDLVEHGTLSLVGHHLF